MSQIAVFVNIINYNGDKRTLSQRSLLQLLPTVPTMADDEFFDCFPSFSNFLRPESPTETTEDWDHLLESQMSWGDDQLLDELSNIPLVDIPPPDLPTPLEPPTDTAHDRGSTESPQRAHIPSLVHDHTYVQRPTVVSKVLVVRDGKSSVKETPCVRSKDCSLGVSSEGVQTQLTMVSQGELPLVLAHEDVGKPSLVTVPSH